MKRFNAILTVVCVLASLSQAVMAKEVTLHFFVPYQWDSYWQNNQPTPGIYIYNDRDKSNVKEYSNAWPGDLKDSHKGTWTLRTSLYGFNILDWTGEILDSELSGAMVILNDGKDGWSDAQKPYHQTSTGDGFKVIDGAYYDANGITDTGFEMVMSLNGQEKVIPMSASRIRKDNGFHRDGEGNYSTLAYTAGFKDEILPGKAGDKVAVYVRGKNYKTNNLIYRPKDSDYQKGDNTSFGSNQVVNGTYITNLKYYGTTSCMDFESANTSNNTFFIEKGSGVSYTVGLYNGTSEYAKHEASGSEGNVSYSCASRSLSLSVNESVIDTYKRKYGNEYGSYDKSKGKSSIEDYYLIGTWNGANYSDEIADDNKMVKQVFLNPINKEQVDSIVYSKVVAKPAKGFNNLYLSFVPQHLANDDTNTFKCSDIYTGNQRYNFVTRAEVQDQYDATATEGSVMVSGVYAVEKIANGQQAINPLVTTEEGATHNYYIVRLNVTTSTYRIEFVDDIYALITKSGIRTFCSKLNLKIPDGFKAYEAYAFNTDKRDNNASKGLHGDVELRQLKYIPANEAVVLVAEKVPTADYNQKFEVLTDASQGDIQLTENEEDWWVKSAEYTEKGQTYKNYLVPSLFGTTIENGIYTMDENNHYVYHTRHFALNYYHNTAYYKSLSKADQDKNENKDYIGFFRSHGNVPAGFAYLSLPSDVLDYNGQIMGDFDSNNDGGSSSPSTGTTSQAKTRMGLSFDDVDSSTTGIFTVKDNTNATDDAYYNLQGMRVAKPVKGIFIHQGKKVIFK